MQIIILQILSPSALRAMTGLKWEGAVMLFLVFRQLLERRGAFGDVHRNEFRCYKIFRAWRHLVLNPQFRKRFKIRLRFIPRRGQIFVALGKRSRSKTMSKLKWWLDRATQGKMATTKTVRDQRSIKVLSSLRTGRKYRLKNCSTVHNNVLYHYAS